VCEEEWRRVALAASETQRMLSPAGMPALTGPLRNHGAPLGAPLILSPRMQVPTTAASLLNGSAAQAGLIPDHHGLIYAPYDFSNYLAASAATPLMPDYGEHTGALFAF